MGKCRRQLGLESETVGQHEIDTLFPELRAEIAVSVKNMTDDRFRRGDVHIAFIHGRSGHEPSLPLATYFFRVSYFSG